jgi:3-deoxy-D-manno-octulosonic-acid transferase
LLSLYLAGSARSGPVARWQLGRRKTRGKEHAVRWPERTGEASLERPEGEMVWFHAASVGEAASLLELLRRLTTERPGLTCLVTTVTVTSQQFLANRLPERCIHQFVPVDVRPWMARFLDHWRPDMAVWTESEFWPAMLVETHARGIPMLLMNARISERSYKRWRVAGALPASLLQRFGRVLAQDDLAGEHLRALGADPDRLTVTGTLKEGAAPLPHDEDERKRVTRAFKGRPVWLAASTHSGEEEAAIAAHLAARKVYPQLALVLVPRHPVRGDGLAEMLRGEGFELAQRSKGETVGEDTDICLADTLGELGLWYRLATVSFVGGSLVEVGGHNPFEPALLGSAILHGPHVRNFAGAYERLEHAGAAVEVRDGESLGAALITALRPDRAAAMAAAGWAACSEGAYVTDTVLEAITSVLDAPG